MAETQPVQPDAATPGEMTPGEATPAPAVPQGPITLTDKAVKMIKITRDEEGIDADHGLRVAVRGGGCSGFEYALDFGPEELHGRYATYTGLDEISTSGAAEVVDAEGEARLLRLLPCRLPDGSMSG